MNDLIPIGTEVVFVRLLCCSGDVRRGIVIGYEYTHTETNTITSSGSFIKNGRESEFYLIKGQGERGLEIISFIDQVDHVDDWDQHDLTCIMPFSLLSLEEKRLLGFSFSGQNLTKHILEFCCYDDEYEGSCGITSIMNFDYLKDPEKVDWVEYDLKERERIYEAINKYKRYKEKKRGTV
jgi:hypothetical protein